MSNEFSSSTSSTISNASSTTPMTSASSTNPASYEAFLKQHAQQYAQQYAERYAEQYTASLKPRTPAQIRAAGEVKVKIGILWLMGAISVPLVGIGAFALFKDPANAKDVWVIIGPILTAALTGTAAYFTGEKQGSQK